jgi:hypothetical protein
MHIIVEVLRLITAIVVTTGSALDFGTALVWLAVVLVLLIIVLKQKKG